MSITNPSIEFYPVPGTYTPHPNPWIYPQTTTTNQWSFYSNLPTEMSEWLQEHYGSVENGIKSLISSAMIDDRNRRKSTGKRVK